MKTLNFKKIDAFATKISSGNPAGCIILESKSQLMDAEMQQIARELKGFVSEVGYIAKQNDDLYILRYFSSEKEVNFCGHATIAIMYEMIKNNPLLLLKNQIMISTNKGLLTIENQIKENDSIFVFSPIPTYTSTYLCEDEIADSLGIDKDSLDSNYEIEVINAGNETLIVPISSLDCILNMKPDFEKLKAFCIRNRIEIITVFCDKVTKNSNFRTRVFAPTFGYLEDPATGSGNSAFGYYLLSHDLWDGNMLIIEQNSFADNCNIIRLKTKIDENDIKRVLFGGSAVKRMEGVYYL